MSYLDSDYLVGKLLLPFDWKFDPNWVGLLFHVGKFRNMTVVINFQIILCNIVG